MLCFKYKLLINMTVGYIYYESVKWIRGVCGWLDDVGGICLVWFSAYCLE